MPELTFSLAKRFLKYRRSFALECKTNLLSVPDGTECRDESLGLLAVPYTPRRCAVRHCWKALVTVPCGHVFSGWWTNGFAILKDPPASYLRNCRDIELANADKLLTPSEDVVLGCLVYYRRAQEAPMAVLMSETQSLPFHLIHLDSVFFVASRAAAEIRLSFNESCSGVVISADGVVVAYLAKLEPPKTFGAALLAHARKYYAHCRNRPQPV